MAEINNLATKNGKRVDIGNGHLYLDSSGAKVPSVTTVIGMISKPAVIQWANRKGLEGISINDENKENLTVGTVTHEMISRYLSNEDVEDYISSISLDNTDRILSTSIDCFNRFRSWFDDLRKIEQIEVLYSEIPLVSNKGFGGTIDAVFNVNGNIVIADFKTSRDIYDDYSIQVAAYSMLFEENFRTPVNSCIIICIPKYSKDVKTKVFHDLKKERSAFIRLLRAYESLIELGYV